MTKLRYFICILILYVLPLNAFSQDISQVTFLGELDKKAGATYGDALTMFNIQSGSSVSGKGASASKTEMFALKGYTDTAPLTKGMASLMTAKYLNLGGSFMYAILKTERYAYKACLANEIFSKNESENDRMSGPELIELFSRISDIKGGK